MAQVCTERRTQRTAMQPPVLWYLHLLLAPLLVLSRSESKTGGLRSASSPAESKNSKWQRLREVAQKSSLVLPDSTGAYAKVGASAVACGIFLPSALELLAGVIRAARFWGRALPIYLKYRRMERGLEPGLTEEEIERCWDETHEKHAPEVLQLLLDLRGFYVKIGQVASTIPDMFPKPYIDALKQLQGEHPELLARPLNDVRRIIRNDLGRKAVALSTLSSTPIGAAATGQVHRATLPDGTEVVVKVQYPEAHQLFVQDFANTRAWCTLLMPEYLPYIKEVQGSFLSEFDFRQEAVDLAEISRNFADASKNPYAALVRIPRPVLELSSRNVVVMEFLPGETLLGYGLRKQAEVERASFAMKLWQGWMLLRELRFHLEVLIGVQGYQIFVDGVFNGDPHPGNILLMPDGRLGLIDYGNVNRLSVEARAGLGNLVMALAREDKRAVVQHALDMGYRTENGDEEILFRYLRFAFDRSDPESMIMPDGTPCSNVQHYLEALDAADPLKSVPPGLVMAARNSILLRGLATHFGVRLRMATSWRDLAEFASQRVAGQDIAVPTLRRRRHALSNFVVSALPCVPIGFFLLVLARCLKHRQCFARLFYRSRDPTPLIKAADQHVVQNSAQVLGA